MVIDIRSSSCRVGMADAQPHGANESSIFARSLLPLRRISHSDGVEWPILAGHHMIPSRASFVANLP